MRAFTNSSLVFDTAAAAVGAGQQVLFFQGEVLSVVLARAAAVVAELAAEQGATWQVVFIELAGAGSGGQFVLELRLADSDAAGVDPAQGILATQFTLFGSQAAQSDAAALAYIQSLQAFAAAAAGRTVSFGTMLLAGASLGTPVSDVTVAPVSVILL